MFSKILAFGAILAAASASLYGHDHGHHYGHAISTQSIYSHHQAVDYAEPASHYSSSVADYAAPIAYYEAPVAHYAAPEAHYADHDTYAHPEYDFAYSVSDPHTGDHKSQYESRDGDSVHGYYSLAQPDGTVRKVEYTSDEHSGFNAYVHNSAPSIHPQTYEHDYYY